MKHLESLVTLLVLVLILFIPVTPLWSGTYDLRIHVTTYMADFQEWKGAPGFGDIQSVSFEPHRTFSPIDRTVSILNPPNITWADKKLYPESREGVPAIATFHLMCNFTVNGNLIYTANSTDHTISDLYDHNTNATIDIQNVLAGSYFVNVMLFLNTNYTYYRSVWNGTIQLP